MPRKNISFHSFTEIGKWWFKDAEIDIVATDNETRTATFLETKWSTIGHLDSERILERLKGKARQFRWDREKENYGIVAKEIEEKQRLRNDGYIALDLDDFE